MPGVALFNCITTAFGLILMYNILPETEGRTLEDIELHFSDNSKNITDRKISKLKSMQTQEKEKESDLSTKPVTINNGIYKNGCDNQGFTEDS